MSNISNYDLMVATTISTLAVFLGDLLRRWLFPKLKLQNDLARKRAGLPLENE